MREIKFRAWDKEEERWYRPIHEAYRGNLRELLIGLSGDLMAHTTKGIEHESLWPDRYVLMQYTGLKDKNGVEIYEGDIVLNNDLNWEIYWKDCGWSMREAGKPANEYIFLIEHPHSEVIGNIYENPELLEAN